MNKNLKQIFIFLQNDLFALHLDVIERNYRRDPAYLAFFHENLKGGWLFGHFQTLKFSEVEGVYAWQAITSSKNKYFLLEKSFIFNLRIIFNITKDGNLKKYSYIIKA